VLRGGALSTGALAGRLAISAPAVTQLVDRLGKKRLIQSRRPETGDRRAVELSLSKTGRLMIDGFRNRRNQAFAAAISSLGSADRMLVMDSLHKLASALEAARGLDHIRSLETGFVEGATRTAVVSPTASNTTEEPVKGSRVRKLRLEWD